MRVAVVSDPAAIRRVLASQHQPGTAYVSYTGLRNDDFRPFLYKTTDYGRTWQKITDGIRPNDFAYVIREDPVRRGLLYAGTETGAYVSFDAGANWQSLQRNLPPVAVAYLQVKHDDLVAATHGRGVWIMDNVDVLRQLTPETMAVWLGQVTVGLTGIMASAAAPWAASFRSTGKGTLGSRRA